MSLGFLGFFLLVTNLLALLLYRHWQQQRQAELALQKSEHEFRTLAENLPDCVVRYTPDARVIYINSTLENVLGTKLDDIVGTKPTERHQDAGFREYEARIIAVANSGILDELELSHPQADGSVRHNHMRMVAERNKAGEIVSVLAIGHNITERKEMEESLKRHEQHLQHIAFHDPLTGLPNR